MPYITQKRREAIVNGSDSDGYFINTAEVKTVGELNFAITVLYLEYVNKAVNYTRINDVMGVLTCASQEFYWRVARHYEERKRIENGDVY